MHMLSLAERSESLSSARASASGVRWRADNRTCNSDAPVSHGVPPRVVNMQFGSYLIYQSTDPTRAREGHGILSARGWTRPVWRACVRP